MNEQDEALALTALRELLNRCERDGIEVFMMRALDTGEGYHYRVELLTHPANTKLTSPVESV